MQKGSRFVISVNRPAILSLILIAVSAAVLGANTVGGDVLSHAARILFCALCVVGLATSTIREALLLVASLVLGFLILRTSEGYEALWVSMDLAAYFAAFIVLLTVLKISAERSRSVLAVGRFLTQQPTGRRFFATAIGGHTLGVFLNFGAISLMAPLIQQSAKDASGHTDKALERRQLSALLRGFAWILLWAPTTLTQAVLLALFVDVDVITLIALGIGTSFLMIMVGKAYDRFEWRDFPLSRAVGLAPKPPWRSLGILGLVCTSLILSSAFLKIATGYSTALSLMFVAPSVTIIWFALQRPPGQRVAHHLKAFWPLLQKGTPGLARSAIALGLSGFIGRALAEVLPVESLTQDLDLSSVPGWLFLAVLPILITIGGQVALSPIVLVVFLGQIVQTLPNLPVEQTYIVFALSAGWAISMFASPNATATLLISATSRIPPTTLTWRWNLKYGLVSYAVLVLIFILLTF